MTRRRILDPFCGAGGAAALRCAAMGIDWMTNDELVQSIPPAYTKFIGGQLLTHVEGAQ